MEAVAEPLSPDDIDLDFVAQLVPGLEVATVGDEQIVIGSDARVVVLNPTAALVFRFLDGEATLRELVDDFSEVLDVDHDVVEADVVSFVRDLAMGGLLEGVALAPVQLPEGFDADSEPPQPVVVGAELADFTLADLDGAEHTLSQYRGSRVLLVNWSPSCGFCVAIADELGRLQPLLAEHDVHLLLVTAGDAEANRVLHESHGLGAITLLRDGTDVDPFHGTGTPAAYLLDTDGTVAEPLVVGANNVPMLARDLAGVDPATPLGLTPAPVAGDALLDADEVRGEYLPAPGATCGPGGGGGGAANSTTWQGTRAYALGRHHVGIRYDTPETAEVLDRLFAGARVNDRRVPDNYSVALGSARAADGAAVSHSLKLLVHGSTQLVRSRSSGRVLAALLQYLSSDLLSDLASAAPSFVHVSSTAVVRDGDALLLPPGLVNAVKQLQPRLAKAGIGMVDTPRTLLDVDARELVVPEPVVAHDPAVIDDLDAGATLGNELPRVRPGRYPLRAWFVMRDPRHRGRLSPATAVTATLPLLYELDDLHDEVVRFAELFRDLPVFGIWSEGPADLVAQVVRGLA